MGKYKIKIQIRNNKITSKQYYDPEFPDNKKIKHRKKNHETNNGNEDISQLSRISKKEHAKSEKMLDKQIKDYDNRKLRKTRYLADLLNINFNNKAFIVIFTVDDDHYPKEMFGNEGSPKEAKYNYLCEEYTKFIKRLNLRINNHPTYIYVVSESDVSGTTGEINISRPHIHAIIHSSDFSYDALSKDIFVHTMKNETIKLSDEWGIGTIYAEPVRSAADAFPAGTIDGDEISFLKDNHVAIDLGGLAKYFVDQSMVTNELFLSGQKKIWKSSMNLIKPDKGYIVPYDIASKLILPDGLKMLDDPCEYGTISKYRETHLYATRPGNFLDELRKLNSI